jgi:hypothetical protein
MADERVVVSLASAEIETSALARDLIDQQKKKHDTTFAYCTGCANAVSVESARKAIRAGRVVLCRRCAIQRSAKRKKNERVYLCSQCRKPLTDERRKAAMRASKRGISTTCGAASCKHRGSGGKSPYPPLPCAVCGEPTSPRASSMARNSKTGNAKAYCDTHAPRRKK